jgi:hypothetical protein
MGIKLAVLLLLAMGLFEDSPISVRDSLLRRIVIQSEAPQPGRPWPSAAMERSWPALPLIIDFHE